MQISTKTLASLLVVTSVAVMPGITRRTSKHRKQSRFDRLLQRHDRKGELRAEVLAITPQAFRESLKKNTFEQVVRRHGFLNEHAFRVALLGWLKMELRHRGWTTKKINSYIGSRHQRVLNLH